MKTCFAALFALSFCCAVLRAVAGEDAAGEKTGGPETETQKNERFQELVDQAVRERDARNYVRALKLLNEVLGEKPDHKNALYARAWTYILTYRYAEATTDINRVIALDPLPREYYYTCGVIAKDLGKKEEALTWFAQTLERGFYAKALRYVIEINLELGNYDAVLSDCEWLEKHEPGARVNIYRAQALLGLGRLDEALDECNKVLVTGNEKDREGWHYVVRSDVYLKLGELEKAYYDLTTATTKAGGTRDAYLKLGNFVMDYEPDYRQAIAYYTVLVDVAAFYVPETVPESARHEPAVARLRRGQAYMALASRGATSATRFGAEALKDFTKYIALEPTDAKGYAERARAYVALGDGAKAEADLVQAIALDVTNAEYKTRLEQIRAGAAGAGAARNNEQGPSQSGGGAQ